MKKLLILSSIFLASFAMAFGPVWKSSHTTTADTTQILCPGFTSLVNTSTITFGNLGILHGVCVNNPISGGTITVYDSSSTATNALLVANSTTTANSGCHYYDILVSSGMVYTTSQPNDTTFLYTCF